MTDPSGDEPGSPTPGPDADPSAAARTTGNPSPAEGPDLPSDAHLPVDSGGSLDDHDAPRVSMFSLEGRAAPALYLIGWVGSVMGLAVLLVSFLAAGNSASPWIFLAGLLVLVLGLIAAAGSQAVERARRQDLAYRGPSPVILLIVVIALTLVAIVVVLLPLSALGLDTGSPTASALSFLVATLVYVGVLRLLVVGPGALSWGDMGLRVPAAKAVRDVIAGAALALPVLGLTLILGALLSQVLEPTPIPLPAATDTLGRVMNLVSAAILAPLGEELFFRGFATTAWARAFGRGQAIVRGGLFFALAHLVTVSDASFAEGAQRALFSFVALLPVALVLGWLFLARRSLYASIGLHASFNALQLIALYLAAAAV